MQFTNNFFLFISQPQSQINKCNNEKRRREQENEYIEQLGEFIHINKRDMNAPKPDKAAILNEVVKHVSIFFLFSNKNSSVLRSNFSTGNSKNRKSNRHFPLFHHRHHHGKRIDICVRFGVYKVEHQNSIN